MALTEKLDKFWNAQLPMWAVAVVTAFYCNLTDTQTGTLNPGSFRYQVKATLVTSANIVTTHTGTLIVKSEPDVNV